MHLTSFKPAPSAEAGSTLLVTALLALVTAGLLSYVIVGAQQEYNMVDRSQAWNSALVLAEAGVEEGMTLINNGNWPVGGNPAADGWSINGPVFNLVRTMSTNIGFYSVTVTNLPGGPVVYAVGYAYCNDAGLHSNQVARAVLIRTTSTFPFPGALTLQMNVDFNGNNVTVDSFDSSDPYHSVWPGYPGGLGYGLYTNTQSTYNNLRKNNGDVATDGSLVGIISSGNAQIYGTVDTGPGGTTSVGANGSIGSLSWVDGGSQGIQPGWSSSDMNVQFPNVSLPVTNWVSLANNATINSSGYYRMDQINGTMSINGSNVVLYVPNGINLGGNSVLTIGTNASVNLYFGNGLVENGNGAINNLTQHASQLLLWGLTNATAITLTGNGAFWGAIYAPNADVNLKGAGNAGGFYGALTAYRITMTGNSTFSYDEALRKLAINNGYVVNYWAEVAPP